MNAVILITLFHRNLSIKNNFANAVLINKRYFNIVLTNYIRAATYYFSDFVNL